MPINGNVYGVLLKYPEPGRVKRRLAKDIGEERAAEIYRETACRVLRRTLPQEGGYSRIIFFSPPDARNKCEGWISGERLMPQSGDDLGKIMHNALRDIFASGAGKAVLTGTDIPNLDRTIILRGFSELDRSDVVVGPAKDGGYYLIGMKSLHPELFRGITWSSGMVLNETLCRARELNLTFSLLRELGDLDRGEDLAQLDSLQE